MKVTRLNQYKVEEGIGRVLPGPNSHQLLFEKLDPENEVGILDVNSMEASTFLTLPQNYSISTGVVDLERRFLYAFPIDDEDESQPIAVCVDLKTKELIYCKSPAKVELLFSSAIPLADGVLLPDLEEQWWKIQEGKVSRVDPPKNHECIEDASLLRIEKDKLVGAWEEDEESFGIRTLDGKWLLQIPAEKVLDEAALAEQDASEDPFTEPFSEENLVPLDLDKAEDMEQLEKALDVGEEKNEEALSPAKAICSLGEKLAICNDKELVVFVDGEAHGVDRTPEGLVWEDIIAHKLSDKTYLLVALVQSFTIFDQDSSFLFYEIKF